MTREEIKEYVRNCPYSDKSIDSRHICNLEFHYRKICPSSECACAKRFGLAESEVRNDQQGIILLQKGTVDIS